MGQYSILLTIVASTDTSAVQPFGAISHGSAPLELLRMISTCLKRLGRYYTQEFTYFAGYRQFIRTGHLVPELAGCADVVLRGHLEGAGVEDFVVVRVQDEIGHPSALAAGQHIIWRCLRFRQLTQSFQLSTPSKAS